MGFGPNSDARFSKATTGHISKQQRGKGETRLTHRPKETRAQRPMARPQPWSDPERPVPSIEMSPSSSPLRHPLAKPPVPRAYKVISATARDFEPRPVPTSQEFELLSPPTSDEPASNDTRMMTRPSLTDSAKLSLLWICQQERHRLQLPTRTESEDTEARPFWEAVLEGFSKQHPGLVQTWQDARTRVHEIVAPRRRRILAGESLRGREQGSELERTIDSWNNFMLNREPLMTDDASFRMILAGLRKRYRSIAMATGQPLDQAQIDSQVLDFCRKSLRDADPTPPSMRARAAPANNSPENPIVIIDDEDANLAVLSDVRPRRDLRSVSESPSDSTSDDSVVSDDEDDLTYVPSRNLSEIPDPIISRRHRPGPTLEEEPVLPARSCTLRATLPARLEHGPSREGRLVKSLTRRASTRQVMDPTGEDFRSTRLPQSEESQSRVETTLTPAGESGITSDVSQPDSPVITPPRSSKSRGKQPAAFDLLGTPKTARRNEQVPEEFCIRSSSSFEPACEKSDGEEAAPDLESAVAYLETDTGSPVEIQEPKGSSENRVKRLILINISQWPAMSAPVTDWATRMASTRR